MFVLVFGLLGSSRSGMSLSFNLLVIDDGDSLDLFEALKVVKITNTNFETEKRFICQFWLCSSGQLFRLLGLFNY